MTTTDPPIDPTAPTGHPLVRLHPDGASWIANVRHGERFSSTARPHAATALLAGLANAGVELDERSRRVLRALETLATLNLVERIVADEWMPPTTTAAILWLIYASDASVRREFARQPGYLAPDVRGAVDREALARGLVP